VRGREGGVDGWMGGWGCRDWGWGAGDRRGRYGWTGDWIGEWGNGGIRGGCGFVFGSRVVGVEEFVREVI